MFSPPFEFFAAYTLLLMMLSALRLSFIDTRR